MTDRHGNILSLDPSLQLVEHGRCSQDQYDDYPSAVYPSAGDAFYVSQRRCVTLSLSAGSQRDIMQVKGEGDRCGFLSYNRAKGYEITVGREKPRPLPQDIVGLRYEFEFHNFKAAWSPHGTVAFTKTPRALP